MFRGFGNTLTGVSICGKGLLGSPSPSTAKILTGGGGMPLADYFKGHGDEVAKNMKSQYGDKWKQVFYATSNKMKKKKKKGSGKLERELMNS